MSQMDNFYCPSCGRVRRRFELKQVGSPRDPLLVCPACDVAVTKEKDPAEAKSFVAELTKAFLYPFGLVPAITAVGVVLITTPISYIPLVGWLKPAIIVSYWFAIVRHTAKGDDDIDASADDVNMVSLWFGPLFRYLGVLLVAFLPAILALYMVYEPFNRTVAIAAAAVGGLYLPAGLLVAAHRPGCLGALNPVPAIRLIAGIPGPYFTTVAFMVLAAIAAAPLIYAAQQLTSGPLGIAFGRQLLANLLWLPGLMIMGRMLGVLVREHAVD